MASTSFLQELFKERDLRPFKAQQEELEIAKQSLIYKKKCNANVHSLLFCKAFQATSSGLSTLNEKKILEDQKHKYFEYVRKAFKEKIPEDFESENKLKKALKNKIIEKKQKEAAKNQEEAFKRPRGSVQAKKDKQLKQKEQNGTKKLKKAEQKQEKKIIADQQASNEVFEDDNFESEVNLDNDEMEDYENQHDQA